MQPHYSGLSGFFFQEQCFGRRARCFAEGARCVKREAWPAQIADRSEAVKPGRYSLATYPDLLGTKD